MNYIIFYDTECPLCQRSVRFVLAADKKQLFYFAPLKGETAAQIITALPRSSSLDTMILYEKGELLVAGKAALRVLWLLGGKYRWLGWLFFVPAYLVDPFYHLIARNRYRLFKTKFSPDVNFSDRFLP